MRWIRFVSLFATWTYAVWQQPPAGLGNLPFIALPGLLLVLVLEDDEEEPLWPHPD